MAFLSLSLACSLLSSLLFHSLIPPFFSTSFLLHWKCFCSLFSDGLPEWQRKKKGKNVIEKGDPQPSLPQALGQANGSVLTWKNRAGGQGVKPTQGNQDQNARVDEWKAQGPVLDKRT